MNTYRGLFRSGRPGGFTLVEMLLVLVILATLAAIVVPKVAGRGEQAKLTAAGTQISNFSSALDAFEVDNSYYPQGADGLLALMEQPSNAPHWKGPYLRNDIPNDPWGNPYIYESPARHSNQGYDLSSMGPDSKAGTADDITSWKTEAN